MYSNWFMVFKNWMNLKISKFSFNFNFNFFDNTNPQWNFNFKNFVTNFSDEIFWGTNIWEILHNPSYDRLWTNLKTIHTYFISKPNYFLESQLSHSFSLLATWIWKGNLTCAYFMSMIFISIQIKFDTNINYYELLETMWEHNKRKKKYDHCW
jgi:hypothetical protein